eukprot:3701573-Rhodomonas_salina.1
MADAEFECAVACESLDVGRVELAAYTPSAYRTWHSELLHRQTDDLIVAALGLQQHPEVAPQLLAAATSATEPEHGMSEWRWIGLRMERREATETQEATEGWWGRRQRAWRVGDKAARREKRGKGGRRPLECEARCSWPCARAALPPRPRLRSSAPIPARCDLSSVHIHKFVRVLSAVHINSMPGDFSPQSTSTTGSTPLLSPHPPVHQH